MKYRPHRRLLSEAMDEVVEVAGRAGLVAHLADDFAAWGYQLDEADVKVEPYGHDDRIGWDTHIVTIRNKQVRGGIWYFGKKMGPLYFGAIGFTDGPA